MLSCQIDQLLTSNGCGCMVGMLASEAEYSSSSLEWEIILIFFLQSPLKVNNFLKLYFLFYFITKNTDCQFLLYDLVYFVIISPAYFCRNLCTCLGKILRFFSVAILCLFMYFNDKIFRTLPTFFFCVTQPLVKPIFFKATLFIRYICGTVQKISCFLRESLTPTISL